MALFNEILVAIKLTHDRVLSFENGLPFAKSHRAPHLTLVMLGHINDDGMRRVGVNLGRVGVCLVEDVPSEFNYGALEAEADTEQRFAISSSPLGRGNFTLHTSLTKASRNQDS